jgi:hypothetical protein
MFETQKKMEVQALDNYFKLCSKKKESTVQKKKKCSF